jgi:alpha-ribazole phosphatase
VGLSLPDRTGATRVVIVRHAEPDASAQGRCYGRLDVGLSASGRKHAKDLGNAIASLGVEAMYASPLRRSLETARLVGKRLGLEPQVRPDLRELDFGELEGRTYDEIAASEPALYHTWMETPTAVRFPGGESYADLHARVGNVLARIRQDHPDSVVAVVAHGGVNRVLLAIALGLRGDEIFGIEQGYGRVSVVDWSEEAAVVHVVNADLARAGAW